MCTCSSAGIVTGLDLTVALPSFSLPGTCAVGFQRAAGVAGAQTLLEHSIVSALKP